MLQSPLGLIKDDASELFMWNHCLCAQSHFHLEPLCPFLPHRHCYPTGQIFVIMLQIHVECVETADALNQMTPEDIT